MRAQAWLLKLDLAGKVTDRAADGRADELPELRSPFSNTQAERLAV